MTHHFSSLSPNFLISKVLSTLILNLSSTSNIFSHLTVSPPPARGKPTGPSPSGVKVIPGFIPLELPSRQPPSPSAGDPKRWGSPLLPGGLLQASLSDPGCCAPRSSGFGDVMHFQRKLAEPRQSHFKSQATAASHVKPQQPPSHHLSALTLLWSVGRN